MLLSWKSGIFMKKVVVKKINKSDKPSKELKKALKESKKIIKEVKSNKRKGYKNLEDLFNSLES